jgi:hypothetical protein
MTESRAKPRLLEMIGEARSYYIQIIVGLETANPIPVREESDLFLVEKVEQTFRAKADSIRKL